MAKVYTTIAEMAKDLELTPKQVEKLNVNGILRPKLSHRWRISASGFLDAPEFSLQTISCSRPVVTHDEIPVVLSDGTPGYKAGRFTLEPLTIVLQDDEQGKVSRIIQQQLEQQQRSFMEPDDPYKFALCVEYPNGDGTVMDACNFEGCFIQQADYAELDYSSSAIVSIELTVRFDNFKFVV